MKIKQVSTHLHHTIILTEENEVFTFGSNDKGQLGNGLAAPSLEEIRRNEKTNYPTNITKNFHLQNNEIIIKVLANYELSFVLSSKGRLFVFGGEMDSIQGSTPKDITSRVSLNSNEFITDFYHAEKLLIITNEGRILTHGRINFFDDDISIDLTKDLSLGEHEKIINAYSYCDMNILLTNNKRLFKWGRSRIETDDDMITENNPALGIKFRDNEEECVISIYKHYLIKKPTDISYILDNKKVKSIFGFHALLEDNTILDLSQMSIDDEYTKAIKNMKDEEPMIISEDLLLTSLNNLNYVTVKGTLMLLKNFGNSQIIEINNGSGCIQVLTASGELLQKNSSSVFAFDSKTKNSKKFVSLNEYLKGE